MPVDLNDIIAAEQAAGLRRQGDATTTFLATLDRKFLQTFTEPGIIEAAATKEISSGSMPRDLAGMSSARQTPQAAAAGGAGN
jgi:hypothetical protein